MVGVEHDVVEPDGFGCDDRPLGRRLRRHPRQQHDPADERGGKLPMARAKWPHAYLPFRLV